GARRQPLDPALRLGAAARGVRARHAAHPALEHAGGGVMLELRALSRRYGARVALDGVSFAVRAGEIAGLLGANGAGKSTLLRTAAGLQPPAWGAVLVEGHDVWAEPLAAKRALGYAAEEPTFHDELSAHEYLAFVSAVRGLPPEAAHARTT